MATQTLQREDVFPVGTSVSAYPLANWPQSQRPPAGAPVGSPTVTATVQAGGVVTFTGLADSTDYVAYAASPDRYIRFRTPRPSATLTATDVGRSGSSPLVDGVAISDLVNDAGTGTADHKFTLSPRTLSLSWPVPTIRPFAANKVVALDIMPNGAPSQIATNGLAWIDVCDVDVLDVSGGNIGCLRMGIFTDHAEIGTRKFSSGTLKQLWIDCGSDGSNGTPMIKLTPTTNPSIRIGMAAGQSVVLGPSAAQLATTATLGFVHISSMAGTPTGVPTSFGAGVVPLTIDTTGSKLWANIGGVWKSVTFA